MYHTILNPGQGTRRFSDNRKKQQQNLGVLYFIASAHFLMHLCLKIMLDSALCHKLCAKPLKPVLHQPCGSRAPICDHRYLGFVRQPHGVVNNTARLPYEKQGRKASATNSRQVHFLCDLFAFSERSTTAGRHTRLPQDCCKTCKVFVRLT